VKVLLVDDDMGLLDLGAHMVKRLGHKVVLAANGIEAEALAMTEQPDVILLDVLMPIQDGFETLKHLRASGYKGAVIVTSALLTRSVEGKTAAFPGTAYLQKPFTSQRLAELLGKVAPTESKP